MFKNNWMIALCTAVIIGLGGWWLKAHLDKEFVHDEFYQGSLQTYTMGRFSIDVPVEFENTHAFFSITPTAEHNKFETQSFSIQEIPWRTEDHLTEFDEYTQLYFKRVNLNTYPNSYSALRDSQWLFEGHRSCYTVDKGTTTVRVETFVALNEGLLHFTEIRNFSDEDTLLDFIEPTVELFNHYRWSKHSLSPVDLFHTTFGVIENYPCVAEECMLKFTNAQGAKLTFSTQSNHRKSMTDDKALTTEELTELSEKHGLTFKRFRERKHSQAGYNQMEYISKFSDKHRNGYIVTFSYLNPKSQGANPKRPSMTMSLNGPWTERKNLMPVWNSVLQSIQPATLAGQ